MAALPGFLESFNPDAEALLRALSARIDDDMLREIAASDYGQGLGAASRPAASLA
jgi:hypothetical protein